MKEVVLNLEALLTGKGIMKKWHSMLQLQNPISLIDDIQVNLLLQSLFFKAVVSSSMIIDANR